MSGTLGSVGPSYYAPNSGLDFEAIDVSTDSYWVYGGSPTSTNPPVYFVEGTVQEPTGGCCLTVDGASTGEISSNKVLNSWTCLTVGWNGGVYTECGLGEVQNNVNPNRKIIQPGDSGARSSSTTGPRGMLCWRRESSPLKTTVGRLPISRS